MEAKPVTARLTVDASELPFPGPFVERLIELIFANPELDGAVHTFPSGRAGLRERRQR